MLKLSIIALFFQIKEDDDYFTCITKAFEILGNPVKRRAFDSVDPLYDDEVPDVLKKDKDKDFIKVREYVDWKKVNRNLFFLLQNFNFYAV